MSTFSHAATVLSSWRAAGSTWTVHQPTCTWSRRSSRRSWRRKDSRPCLARKRHDVVLHPRSSHNGRWGSASEVFDVNNCLETDRASVRRRLSWSLSKTVTGKTNESIFHNFLLSVKPLQQKNLWRHQLLSLGPGSSQIESQRSQSGQVEGRVLLWLCS